MWLMRMLGDSRAFWKARALIFRGTLLMSMKLIPRAAAMRILPGVEAESVSRLPGRGIRVTLLLMVCTSRRSKYHFRLLRGLVDAGASSDAANMSCKI